MIEVTGKFKKKLVARGFWEVYPPWAGNIWGSYQVMLLWHGPRVLFSFVSWVVRILIWLHRLVVDLLYNDSDSDKSG
jgi:hypothetical protein